MAESDFFTIGQLAKRFGCQTWQVGRLFERRLLPEPMRIAGNRVIRADELPAVEQALEQCGYIEAKAVTP
jgi:hypothetical protein